MNSILFVCLLKHMVRRTEDFPNDIYYDVIDSSKRLGVRADSQDQKQSASESKF